MKKKDPTTQQAINLLDQSNEEINRLRQQNQIMGARLEMFDDMMTLMRSNLSYPSYGASVDVVYQNKDFINQHK